MADAMVSERRLDRLYQTIGATTIMVGGAVIVLSGMMQAHGWVLVGWATLALGAFVSLLGFLQVFKARSGQ